MKLLRHGPPGREKPGLLDGEGRILYRHAGPLVDADYEHRFRPELDKALAAER